MNQKLIMTRGLPASGKSYWAKEQVKKSQGKVKRVNKDDLRAMLDDSVYSKANEKFVLTVRDEIIMQALSGGLSVIVDDTNFGAKHERRLQELADAHNVEFEINESFLQVPIATCIERDKQRTAEVGEKVINGMYYRHVHKRVKND